MTTRPCSLDSSGRAEASVSMPAVVDRGSLIRIGLSDATSSSHFGWPSSLAAWAGSIAMTSGLLAKALAGLALSLAASLTRSTQRGESGIQASGRSGCPWPRPIMASIGALPLTT